MRIRPGVVPARRAGQIIMSEINVSDGQPQVFIVGKAPNQRGIAFRRRAPVRSGAPGVVWLSGYRSDMDSTKATALDAEAGKRGLGFLQVRLFRPRALRRAARGRDDLALARGDAGALQGREPGTADSGRLVDGRMAGAARRPGAQRGGRDGAAEGPHSHRAGGRLHRSARVGQGAGRGEARDHGARRVAKAVRLFERARLPHPRSHRGRTQAPHARRP